MLFAISFLLFKWRENSLYAWPYKNCLDLQLVDIFWVYLKVKEIGEKSMFPTLPAWNKVLVSTFCMKTVT